MQVNRVYSNNYSNHPNFGMAVTASAKGKQMLEKCLTPKGAMKLEKIIHKEEKEISSKSLQIYTYDFSDGAPTFIRKK